MSEQTRLLDNPLVLAVPVKLLFGFRPEGECVARINVNVLGSSVVMSAFLSMRLWGRLVIVPLEPPCDAGTYGRRLKRTLNSLTQALAAHAVAAPSRQAAILPKRPPWPTPGRCRFQAGCTFPAKKPGYLSTSLSTSRFLQVLCSPFPQMQTASEMASEAVCMNLVDRKGFEPMTP